MTDHYATLGVPRTAAADEIKQAFRKLASQHHPDKGGDTKKFQEIQAAYAVLGDDTARTNYDNPRQQFGGFTNTGGNPFDLNNMFNMFAQGEGAFFSGGQPKRSHVRMSLWVSLLDIVQGGKRPVSLGTQAGASTIEIEIPLGIGDGDNVQYRGIAPGGQDLVVQFRIHPHPVFRKEGLNLHTEQKIEVWELILGGEIKLLTINGTELIINIPVQCQPNTVLRLKQHGIQDRNGNKGDLLVKLQAQIPNNISPELIEAIKKYK